MKLHCHPISPYARKAMIICRLKGIDVEKVIAVADGDKGYTNGANPLGKIPALEREGLPTLYDSPVVCEYLDSLRNPTLPVAGPERWTQLRFHAMGDGLSDAVYNYRYETVRPKSRHWTKIIRRHTHAIESVIDALESEVETLGHPWEFGTLAIICALDYCSFRAGHVDWQIRAPKLAVWHKRFTRDAVYQDTYAYDQA